MKKFNKVIALVLAGLFVAASFAACSSNSGKDDKGTTEAAKAQNAARALFSGASGDAEHMPNTQLTEADLTDGSIGILTLMVKAGLAASNGEARRLVVQGGVLVDGEKVAAPTVSFTAEQLSKGIVIKKGKKVYHKVSL